MRAASHRVRAVRNSHTHGSGGCGRDIKSVLSEQVDRAAFCNNAVNVGCACGIFRTVRALSRSSGSCTRADYGDIHLGILGACNRAVVIGIKCHDFSAIIGVVGRKVAVRIGYGSNDHCVAGEAGHRSGTTRRNCIYRLSIFCQRSRRNISRISINRHSRCLILQSSCL